VAADLAPSFAGDHHCNLLVWDLAASELALHAAHGDDLDGAGAAHVPGSVIAGLLKIDLAMSASSTINGGTQIDWERVQPV
jgi:hypothetical protein